MRVCTRGKECIGGWEDDRGEFWYRYKDGSRDKGVEIPNPRVIHNKRSLDIVLINFKNEQKIHSFKKLPNYGDLLDALDYYWPSFVGSFNFYIKEMYGDWSKEIKEGKIVNG